MRELVAVLLLLSPPPPPRRVFMENDKQCPDTRNPYVRSHGTTKNDKGKGKVLPRTGHEDPKGEQMYSSTLPSTSALDGGGWSTPRPCRFTPRKDPVTVV